VCFDIIVRWLEASGYQVTYCRNITDLDDKILRAAAAQDVPWWQLAERYQRQFTNAYDLLGCRPPDAEPRATGHIPDIVSLIERLLVAGRAYQAAGGVYFDVQAAKDYGTLSGQRLDGLVPAGEAPGAPGVPEGKRDPRDFALWKAAKPGEPAWRTPWGPGRPGWHVECSAMAVGYLGATFDIHGGGQDLIFPHHENERAQSRAAGDDFARYWMHHGLVTIDTVKLSKSTGHLVTVATALARVRPQELRYYLAQAHYRSSIGYTPDALDEAAAAYRRIERFVTRAHQSVGEVAPAAGLPFSFTAAMDDDLGVPAAFTALHATVRDGNYALSTGDSEATAVCLAQARAMLAVFGLDPLAPKWQAAVPGKRLGIVIDALIELSLKQRAAARDRGDYASADAIRDTLERNGVLVEDTPEGPRWELAR
jgi:cysteinyl-tRNA synthetase